MVVDGIDKISRALDSSYGTVQSIVVDLCCKRLGFILLILYKTKDPDGHRCNVQVKADLS